MCIGCQRERGVCALVMVWREQGGQREGGLRYCIGCRREGEGTGGGRVEVCTFAVRERERGVFIGYGMEGARKWEMGMEGLEGEGMGGGEGVVWGRGSEWENIAQYISME